MDVYYENVLCGCCTVFGYGNNVYLNIYIGSQIRFRFVLGNDKDMYIRHPNWNQLPIK